MRNDTAQAAAGDVPGSRAFLSYLIATAIVCGALVMVIEILGSRVIGPFFGVSLFVWTSLITVTLVALAVGYAVGGVLSDRWPSPASLYSLILAAGLLALLIPLLKAMVLKAALGWGLRVGALASSLVLFGPSLFLLGCVSPYLVKIAAREVRNIGRTVGLFYALSTMGSFLGTVLAGFVLIAYFRVSLIFTVIGTVLIVLSAGYFLLFRRKAVTVAAIVLPLLLWPSQGVREKTREDGTLVTRVADRDTYYGNLKVVDYTGGGLHDRDLLIDGLVQGGVDVSTMMSLYEYSYFLEFLPYGMNPNGKTCLVIGLGAGLIPTWYEQRGIRTDVVDIDPDVGALAREYFGFSISGDVFVEDARYFLNRTDRRYDYVILDVFNGDTTPGHVLSLEALQVLRRRMSDRGILAINLIGSLKRDPFMTASILRTLEKVFASVDIHPNYAVEEEEGGGNITVLASPGPMPAFDRTRVAGFPVHPAARDGVTRFLENRYRLPEGTPAVVLTDDYNPIDFFDVRLKEWVRSMILKNSEVDILISSACTPRDPGPHCDWEIRSAKAHRDLS